MSQNGNELRGIDGRDARAGHAPVQGHAEPPFGEAYRQARAHVIEAGMRGLCRLRVC